MKKALRIVVILLIPALGGFLLYRHFGNGRPGESRVEFQTEAVTRADIRRSISATGTVEPEELVNVGAQVNGKIMEFGRDADGKTVDYGSKVKKGMVLAQIDDVTYKADLQEAEASRQQAEASIMSAEAAIKEAEANELLAKNNWERAQTLYKQKSMTRSDYDSYQAGYFAAVAQTAKSKASLAQAKASLSIAEAALVKSRRNLEYCVITSPVDGVVIDRRVSVGQTVVSNQTASSIFLVAKDFDRMQVWVSLNEADIGSVKPGMPVRFSCDAFPNAEFTGSVARIRLNATLSSNVVTYIVEVNADNKDGKLVPYLTANVKFIRAERLNALAVPASAVRYQPPAEVRGAPAPETGHREAVLWREGAGGKLMPVKVKLGLSNGLLQEIVSDEIKEGDKIVTGMETVSASAASAKGGNDVKNPFMPNMPKRPARGSAGQRQRTQERSR